MREVRNELVVQHGAGCELVARSRAPRFAVVVVVGAEQPAHGRHPPRGGRRLVGVLPTARRDRKLLEKLARTYEPRYTLLRAPPPAHKYRKEAAASTHGSNGRPMKPHAGTLVPHQPRLGLAKKQLRNEDRKSSQHRP